MTQFSGKPDREGRFRALYASVYPDLLRFVQRRTGAHQAEDLVAETFLVVWRRFEDVPSDAGDSRAWIFGICRNIMLNGSRGDQRRNALGLRIAASVAGSPADVALASPDIDLAEQRVDLARAWRQLSEIHQEALGLAVFEELSGPQAASVLGISPVAYRIRLTRARRALRLLLDHLPVSTIVPPPGALPPGAVPPSGVARPPAVGRKP